MTEYGNGNITALFDGIPFDPNDHEPSKDFAVLPPGKYVCLIESAELKDTRDGRGKYIKVVSNVLEGVHAKRKLFDNINICNPSEKCQAIGIAQLSSLGRAAGVFPVEDTSQLVDTVVVAVVKVAKRTDTGEDQNAVRTYESPVATNATQVAPAADAVPQDPQHVPQTPPAALAPTEPAAPASAQVDAPAGRSPWNKSY